MTILDYLFAPVFVPLPLPFCQDGKTFSQPMNCVCDGAETGRQKILALEIKVWGMLQEIFLFLFPSSVFLPSSLRGCRCGLEDV